MARKRWLIAAKRRQRTHIPRLFSEKLFRKPHLSYIIEKDIFDSTG